MDAQEIMESMQECIDAMHETITAMREATDLLNALNGAEMLETDRRIEADRMAQDIKQEKQHED